MMDGFLITVTDPATDTREQVIANRDDLTGEQATMASLLTAPGDRIVFMGSDGSKVAVEQLPF